MYRRRGNEPSSSIDWLPWGLSIFGAFCAVFVLVRGVLPERSANRELVQQVATLETDLSRARQDSMEDLARAEEKLAQQALATQAEVNAARDQERLRAARESARRDLGQSLASEIAAGDVEVIVSFEPPPGQKLDDRYGPATRLVVSATPGARPRNR